MKYRWWTASWSLSKISGEPGQSSSRRSELKLNRWVVTKKHLLSVESGAAAARPVFLSGCCPPAISIHYSRQSIESYLSFNHKSQSLQFDTRHYLRSQNYVEYGFKLIWSEYEPDRYLLCGSYTYVYIWKVMRNLLRVLSNYLMRVHVHMLYFM